LVIEIVFIQDLVNTHCWSVIVYRLSFIKYSATK